MGEMLDNALANISSHILIRDKDTKKVLLSLNPKRNIKNTVQPSKKMEIKEDE